MHIMPSCWMWCVVTSTPRAAELDLMVEQSEPMIASAARAQCQTTLSMMHQTSRAVRRTPRIRLKWKDIPKPLTSIQVLRLTPLRLSPLSTSPHTTSPCSSLTPLRLALVSHGDRGVALKGLYLLIICFGFCIRSIAHGGVDISWYTLL
jgi:hypothetical protein